MKRLIFTPGELELLEVESGILATVAKTEWGWYLELSDGYTSSYYKYKKEALAKLKSIQQEIKKGLW